MQCCHEIILGVFNLSLALSAGAALLILFETLFPRFFCLCDDSGALSFSNREVAVVGLDRFFTCKYKFIKIIKSQCSIVLPHLQFGMVGIEAVFIPRTDAWEDVASWTQIWRFRVLPWGFFLDTQTHLLFLDALPGCSARWIDVSGALRRRLSCVIWPGRIRVPRSWPQRISMYIWNVTLSCGHRKVVCYSRNQSATSYCSTVQVYQHGIILFNLLATYMEQYV